MATATLPRTRRAGFTLDPALLIPVFGAGILIYLAVLPLIMLFIGSFQAEVAPREFVYTLKNYQAAYASQYTYSTFVNSLIFATGSSLLSFFLGTMLAWLTKMAVCAFCRRRPRSRSMPMRNMYSTTPTWLNRRKIGMEDAGNNNVWLAGQNSPSSEGPSTMPANISPMTDGWPILPNSQPTIRVAPTMTTS